LRSQIKSTKHTLQQLVLHWGGGGCRDLPVYTGNLWWVTQSESTTLNEIWPSPTCSAVNPVDHFRWKELLDGSLCLIQPRWSTWWDPCKRALTYLLTPWSRVLLEKLTGLKLVKEFPAFYGTRRFITAFTIVRHLSLARKIQCISLHLTSWRSILILSSYP